ncbi:MAG: hypothetical protein KA314_04285 [Chloroflexi bacterium]|nr:hypothetical protein [Chloroflexota bacterium]MBP8055031.1 hypothetical protein [Chloroflexota bacterium]
MGNLTVLAVIIIIFWLAVLIVYMISSRQQSDIQADIESLEREVEKLEKQK